MSKKSLMDEWKEQVEKLVKNNLDLLEKINKMLKRENFLLKQVILAIKLLTRIKKIYPYIFDECITRKEVEELTKKG